MTVPHISADQAPTPTSLRGRVRRDGVRGTLATVEVLALRRSWSAGFGPTLDPFHANLTGASASRCRKDLDRLLRLYADRLSLGPATRQEFLVALEDLRASSPDGPWTARVTADHHDLTFWMMRDVDAVRRGVRPKR